MGPGAYLTYIYVYLVITPIAHHLTNGYIHSPFVSSGHFEEVYVGGLLVSSPSSTEEMFLVADAFPHPDYDVLNNEYDFAVVQLSRTVNFTDYIRPICLATSQVELLTYHSCYIAGWGTTRYDGKRGEENSIMVM